MPSLLREVLVRKEAMTPKLTSPGSPHSDQHAARRQYHVAIERVKLLLGRDTIHSPRSATA